MASTVLSPTIMAEEAICQLVTLIISDNQSDAKSLAVHVLCSLVVGSWSGDGEICQREGHAVDGQDSLPGSPLLEATPGGARVPGLGVSLHASILVSKTRRCGSSGHFQRLESIIFLLATY